MPKRKVTEQDLIEAKGKWDDDRAQTEDSRSAMVGLIQRAVREGMPQAEIGRIMGWPRQRVAKLL